MSSLCPHCQRVAQQVSANCLYCGKPLGDSPEQAATARSRGNGKKAVDEAALRAPRPGERELEVVAGTAPAARPAPAAFGVTPAEEARRGGGFLGSTVGRAIIFVTAAVMVVIAVATALDGREAPGPAAEPGAPAGDRAPETGPEGAGADLARGMTVVPEPPPDAVRAAASAERTALAREALDQVVAWVQTYAERYGHYPAYLGDRLEAVAEFAGPAVIDQLLNRFEGNRIRYVRGVTGGGDEETFELTATVPGGDTLTAGGNRPR